MAQIALATAWLDGCSGCHMSLLDIDFLLIELAGRVQLVYGPLVDSKDLPERADIALVEGAVSSEADLRTLLALRRSATTLIALGDCAVTANVPGMRNRFPLAEVLRRAYVENTAALTAAGNATEVVFDVVPKLNKKARPIHEFVKVDLFVPGCPPPAAAIARLLSDLMAGEPPDLAAIARFGA